jgi:hypothetical protein
MSSSHPSAPSPDLRVVPTQSLHPHEEHDSQRSKPLIERLRHERHVINPPIVAPMANNQYVILDGANRCYAFSELNYPHSLVQVVSYEDGQVELDTWQHVVGSWDGDQFIQHLRRLRDIELVEGEHPYPIAHVLFRDDRLVSLHAPVETVQERNAALRQVVKIYQRNAVLHRTALTDPEAIWPLYPSANALVLFPHYQPEDIIYAAEHRAYLPPGISRHIVHGRAIRVNYPIEALRNTSVGIDAKNGELQRWMQQKLANRQVRYYAEATYQFDE